MKRVLVVILLTLGSLTLAGAGYQYWKTSRFDTLIEHYSQLYDLEFHVVKALIWEESGFNPSARGRNGEFGLMQIMPYVGREFWEKFGEARDYDPERLLDPEHNLKVGCWYLSDSLNLYRDQDNPLPFALARYNAGQSRVTRWMQADGTTDAHTELDFVDRIEFPGTRQYVLRIIQRSERQSRFYFW